MSGVGHNRGPSMATGNGWQLHCWTHARRALLPTLPLEVVRIRVGRARQLGLDYSTYATVRATTGRDIIAFLFSSNALRVFSSDDELSVVRTEKLAAQRDCQRLLAAHPPLDPAGVITRLRDSHDLVFAGGTPAPGFTDSWSRTRQTLKTLLAAQGLPGDAVLLVGDTALEREWVAPGGMAGYVPASSYFG